MTRPPSLSRHAALVIAALGAIAAAAPAAAASPALDTLFINGTVIVPGGTAQAVAVREGSIVAVGTTAEILARPHARSGIVDLAGHTLMPGLYDSHVHLYMAGLEMRSCHVSPEGGAAALKQSLAACRAGAKRGAWLTGGSWVAGSFRPGEQTARLLDEVSPDNPVVLYDQSRHSAWLNSAALKLAHVTRDTPDPPGGLIERDATGQPTGILREQAQGLAEVAMPRKSLAEQVQAVKDSTDLMLSYGIVGLIDAMVTDEWADALASYARSGQLKQHVRGCIAWRWNGMGGERLFARRQQLTAGRLSLDCVKMFLDGVPLEAQTAAMLEPYHPLPGAAGRAGQPDNRGTLLYTSE
ncbi:MAG TPA: amidohydrolase family protein, partial [Novosphingobium sp.]